MNYGEIDIKKRVEELTKILMMQIIIIMLKMNQL